MDLSIPYQTLASDELGNKGGTFTTPIYLQSDPTVDLEAATKSYVDNKSKFIPADSIKSGLFSVARFPEFTGDVISNAGSGLMYLKPTGVVPGTYTKVTVDTKGRVTEGSQITKDDIPSISWSKFTSDKPTTLAGYGITDAVSKTGDTMTGSLTINAEATADLHAVTKTQVDTAVSNADGLSIGDMVQRASSSPLSGYLRCDGSEKNISSFQELYNVIGVRFGSTLEPMLTFKLPDCSSKEVAGLYFFIKAK